MSWGGSNDSWKVSRLGCQLEEQLKWQKMGDEVQPEEGVQLVAQSHWQPSVWPQLEQEAQLEGRMLVCPCCPPRMESQQREGCTNGCNGNQA